MIATRGNDTGPLKKASLGYIHHDHHAVFPAIELPDVSDKSKRGWNHNEIAYLLMPLEYEATPE